ncbi:MAG: 2-amino-4-hydroxy-6-hydroxymethyldihydropteridine diphosphokinase [Paraglaciecola sp.]|jgi:2-amino-4-hydroxy-6-hydroxymethyldihydropteridine diphosphokinase
MKKTQIIILHTGSNIGNRIANLQLANSLIKKQMGRIVHCSKYYQTAAWGVTEQPEFINQALKVETILSPFDILKNIQEIESKMGRVRLQKWGERLIDIDLIFYENKVVDEENLQVPHPFLQERNFVLVPLQEIAADWEHPIFKKLISELLKESKDELKVFPFGN